MTKSELWILSEWQVAVDRVRFHHDHLVSHRLKTPYAEVDLVFQRPKTNELTLVEVKTSNMDLSFRPISQTQIMRLSSAAIHLGQGRELISMLLAVVSHDGFNYLKPSIQYFDLGDCHY